jgi:hypothetical protein
MRAACLSRGPVSASNDLSGLTGAGSGERSEHRSGEGPGAADRVLLRRAFVFDFGHAARSAVAW